MNSWSPNPWGLLGIVVVFGVLFYIRYSLNTGRGIGAWLQQRKVRREIHLVDQMRIGPRTSLLLVEVKGQTFLVAQSPQSMQVTSIAMDQELQDGEQFTSKLAEARQ